MRTARYVSSKSRPQARRRSDRRRRGFDTDLVAYLGLHMIPVRRSKSPSRSRERQVPPEVRFSARGPRRHGPDAASARANARTLGMRRCGMEVGSWPSNSLPERQRQASFLASSPEVFARSFLLPRSMRSASSRSVCSARSVDCDSCTISLSRLKFAIT